MLKLFVVIDKTFEWVDLMKIDKYLAAFEYTWNLSEVKNKLYSKLLILQKV